MKFPVNVPMVFHVFVHVSADGIHASQGAAQLSLWPSALPTTAPRARQGGLENAWITWEISPINIWNSVEL